MVSSLLVWRRSRLVARFLAVEFANRLPLLHLHEPATRRYSVSRGGFLPSYGGDNLCFHWRGREPYTQEFFSITH